MISKELHDEWLWARGLTVDLLRTASSDDLSYCLDERLGPLWKQFRHIARVQENYLQALESGRVAFTTDGCSYAGGNSKATLLDYYSELADRQKKLLSTVDAGLTIDWFGDSRSLSAHLLSLLTHETLHHGQLILYWKMLGNYFPESWSAWGE